MSILHHRACALALLVCSTSLVAQTPPEWEPNSPGATLVLDGAQVSDPNSPTGGAISTGVLSGRPLAFSGELAFSSTNNGGHDIAINGAPTLPLSQGFIGTLQPDGQVVNLDVLAGISFVYGGAGARFTVPAPVPGLPQAGFSYRAGYTAPSPVRLSIQGVTLDPSSAIGLDISAAARLEIDPPAGFQTGPFLDDQIASISLAAYGDGDFTIGGTTVTDLVLSSNGRIFFGAGSGTNDLSPTIAEAASQDASLNLWTDFSPNLGGSIFALAGPGADEVTIQFFEVPFFGFAGATSTFEFILNTATDELTIDGLSGVAANPSGIAGLGDSMLLGLSLGGVFGATDDGATAFSVGGSGSGSNATSMLYEFLDAGASSGPYQLPAIAAGLNTLTFTPGAGGAYSWAGF